MTNKIVIAKMINPMIATTNNQMSFCDRFKKVDVSFFSVKEATESKLDPTIVFMIYPFNPFPPLINFLYKSNN